MHQVPVLSGAQAQQGQALCRRIAEDIVARADSETSEELRDPRLRVHRAILCEGASGIAEFLSLTGRLFDCDRQRAVARQFHEAAAAAVAEHEMTSALFSGFTGVAWAVHRAGREALADQLPSDLEAAADPCHEIDEFLVDTLQGSEGWQPFDLMTGAAGIAVYALERLPSPGAEALLSACVESLSASACRLENGVAWPVPLRPDAPEYMRATYPPGTFPLGAAHGAAGVIGALARIVARRPEDGRARTLLRDALNFLLASRLPGRLHHSFPRVASDHASWPDHSDMSWCWGDPGIALSLLTAGTALGDEDLRSIAIETMRPLCDRPPDVSEWTDACICHGWAGAAHVFGRFYQATHDAEFATAAGRYWQALFDRATEPGIAGGMLFRIQVPEGGVSRRENLGILNGAAGVGLALLSAIGRDGGSGWDRMLGCAGVGDNR